MKSNSNAKKCSVPASDFEIRMNLIVRVSTTTGCVLALLPREYINGNPVPTILFQGLPWIFQASLIAVMLAFASAFCGLGIRNMDRRIKVMERICSCVAVVSISAAVAILVYVSFWSGLGWVSQQMEVVIQ